MSYRHLHTKSVLTRAPHRCWGCDVSFPPKTRMQVDTSVEDGVIASSWMCMECASFWETVTKDWTIEEYESCFPGDLYQAAIDKGLICKLKRG